jgi:hypothetical protein
LLGTNNIASMKKELDRFEIKPVDYKKRVDQIFTLLSSDKDSTRKAVGILRDLVVETEKLLQVE